MYIQVNGTTTVQNGGVVNVYSNGTSGCGEWIINNGVTMTVDAGGILNINNTYASYAYQVLVVGNTTNGYLIINGTMNVDCVTATATCIWTYNGLGLITINGTLNYTKGVFSNPTFAMCIYRHIRHS